MHRVSVCPTPTPDCAQFSSIVDSQIVVEYQCVAVRLDAAVAVEAWQGDIPVDDLLLARIPGVRCLTLIRDRIAHYYMMVAQEATVVDPLEAVLVGDVAARKSSFPAAPRQIRQRR